MTLALYKQIFKNNIYREKAKQIIVFDEVIDYLISKDIISEKDYLTIWNCNDNKIDNLFHILKSKSNNILQECFNIFKSIYGDDFEYLLKEIKHDILDKIHLKGGFPKVNGYISRVEEEIKIKETFSYIKWDNSLVVYGRVGEGKSFIVCECLKDEDLVWKYFDNKLFWINVGECKNGTNILQPLNRLLRMIIPKKSKIDDLDSLLEELQKLFSLEKYRKSLVILDNARSLEVIETFQKIKCKLIVITHYKSVRNAQFVEINSGFSLNETINLFAQYLETTVENLSSLLLDDIKDIHELCKGHPSTLALLGVTLKCKRNHALVSKELWDDIKEKIDKGEMETLGSDDADVIQRNFHEALRMCIDTIGTEEMKELYYQFAVFPKDANISREVLEVFWGKKSEEVCHIMLHFENRSLINSFYNIKKKAYIYVIHDLFLFYLKNETQARKREFHQKLITAYNDKYKFHMLPDDNYILLFLGYHLKQAEMTDMFEKFLDLRFIAHKVSIVGVNNMEQDLKMYKDEIINGNNDLKTKLESCLKFIRDNKNELQQKKTDIVQLALPTLKDDAQNLMFRNQANSINKLYLTIKFSAGRLKSSQEFLMNEEVTAMAFCTDSNVSKILIGLRNGDVLLYCSPMNKELDRFQGHKKLVSDLKVANDNSCFLSVSNDHTVKLWQFVSQRLSLDGVNTPSSPKCVQNEYFNAFSTSKRHIFKEFTYDEDNNYLISANFCNDYGNKKIICTGTNSGKVILWNSYTKEKLYSTTETGFPVCNIFFSCDDSKILFTKQEKIQIYSYENEQLHYCDSIHNREDIVKMFIPNENTIIAVGSTHVLIYKLPYKDDSDIIKAYENQDHINCAAIAKGEYFAIGVKEKVMLFSVSNGKLVETLEHNKIVSSISMDVSKDDDNITSMLLMSFDDNNVQQCNIMMQHYEQPRNKQGLVTTYWKNTDLPMLAVVLNDNILKIQHEFNPITEVEKSNKIGFITFSLHGNNIIFSLENGNVIEYQYKKQGGFRTLMELKDPVKYLQCFDLKLSDKSEFENGTIVALTDGEKKIHILLENGQMNNYSWDFPINYIFLFDSHKLLCIDESGGVFIIHIWATKNIELLIYAIWYRKVNSVAFSPNNNLIAMAFTNQAHKTNHLDIIDVKENQILKKNCLDFVAKCCAFSYSGNILVLGGDDGKLMVCNIREDFKCKVLINVGLPVKFLQFSQSRIPILIAIGREISWWNLCNFEDETSVKNEDFDFKFWKNKTFHDEIPHLLQTVSLYSYAVHFSVSKNFETFLIVDDESRTYIMKCFKNTQ